jgi:hypothetical protein
MEQTWESQSGGALESDDRVKTKSTLVSIVNTSKPKRLVKAWTKRYAVRHGGFSVSRARTSRLPVYRANLNHPVDLAEHGNAASPARPRDRADLTARRVRGRSLGMTEEANASGNALDRPTSVWSEMARKLGEPPYSGKANDDRRLSVDASRSCCLKGAQRRAAAGQYCQVVRPRLVAGQTAGRPKDMAGLMRA